MLLEREDKKKKKKTGTFASFWKEKGGESSMSQSTAALHVREEVEGDRRALREI